MTRHRRSVRGVLAVALAPFLLVGLLALPATAEQPERLDEPVTDRAGVLDDPDAVRDAIDRLADETRLDLFVVFVETFDGGDRDAWALETAELSGLGDNDVLLAVAVEDRDYWMGSGSTGLSQDQFETVQYDMVEPELADDAWDAAAIAAADGLRQAATGELPGTGGAGDPGDGPATTDGGAATGTSGGASGFLVVLGIGLVVVVVVAVVAALAARRAGSRATERAGPRPEGLEALPTEELNSRASRALVALDDAVTASRQELGFAQAQFGLEATRRFDEVLQHAVGDLREAFTLRQRLDDAEPETEPQRRAMLIEILRRCERADSALDAEVEEFDRLRDLQARAPQVLEDLAHRVNEIRGRVPAAQGEVERLRTRYSAPALASVVENPAQAVALLDSAADLVAEGRDAVAADDRAAAVARARAAEDAVGQAVTLLDATSRAGEELAQAGTRIDEGIRSLRADLADAARLAPDDPAVQAAVVEAEKAVAEAPTERDDGDPLAALRHLTDAETALDAALEPARAQEESDRRARDQLRGLLTRVDAQIRGVADFIETRRGAVGPEARTRLAEASRHAQEAHMLAPAEPRAALAEAQQAERLALQAQQLAQRDLDDWTRRRPPGGGPGGLDVGSLILGGILFGGGHRGGGFGGGFGGGGFGGGGGGFSGGGGGFGGGGGGFSGGGGRF